MDDEGSDLLSHIYDPAKAHQYYEAHKKLMGRKKGAANNAPGTGPSNKQRATSIGRKAKSNLSPEKAKEVRKLVNQVTTQLGKLTDDFRSWINAHPKATSKEKEAQRRVVLSKKNSAIKKLKADVANITSPTSTSGKKTTDGTEGRHH